MISHQTAQARMKRTSLFALCALAVSVPAAWAAPEIAGGTRVMPGHPIARTTVMLAATMPDGNALCSGSILASDIILTAAHCIDQAKEVKIIFGTSADTAVHSTSALKLLIPDLYSQKGVFDIGLIKFGGGLPAGHAAAQILNPKHVFKANDPVVVAGFGITNMKINKGAGVLRSVVERIHPKNEPGAEVLFEHIGNTSVCPGDSGGPSFVKAGQIYALFGVASRIIVSDGPCGSLSIYTDIHNPTVLDFIQQAIKFLRAQ